MAHPARPTVIAENQTASPVLIDDLGITVPASGSYTINDFFYLYEIQGSKSLYDAIVAGDILISDGATTLTLAQSLFFITGVASAQDLQDGVVGPAVSTSTAIPKFGDTTGKSLVNTPVTINASNQLDMASAKILNLATPTAASDAASKGYVDTFINGLDPKASVRAATTANITLSGAQTIDGVSIVAGNRVLAKSQTTGSENGIYVAAAGAWSRAVDMAAGTLAAGVFTFVEEGTNGDKGFLCTNDSGSDVVGTDSLVFDVFSTFQLAIVAPLDVTKAAAAVGTSSRAAREDHKHDVSTAIASTAAVGDAAAEGTATSLARSDHKHALPAPAVPADVTKAAASAGVATTVARADHKHDVSTAIVVSILIGDAAAEGTATSLARSDHKHSLAAPAAPTTVSIGDAASTGASTAPARGDHVHAFPAPVAPADVTKAAASSGSATTAARADHKHDVSTATAGAIAVGDAAAEGAATSLARSDHLHALPAPAAPADVTKAAASAGAATTVARADHKHDVSTAVPASTGTANSEGTATSLARSDHIHRTLVAAQEEGVAVASRPTFNFIGGAITAADNPGSDRIDVTVTAAALTVTAPVNVNKSAAVVGVATDAARADHKHDIDTATAGTIAVGDAAAEGTATSLARADHLHALPAPAAPADVTKAAASAGIATTVARADHKHDVSTAAPGASSVATASAEGTATSLARSDHVHQSNTTPVNVTKAAAAIGTSGEPARADHKHDISTTAPSTQTHQATNTEGTSTSLARADHVHGFTAPGAPADVTKAAAAAGTSIIFAREDHKHDVTTAAPAATGVSTASAEGTATTLARSDHSHQSNTAPVDVTKAAAAIGTSGEPARADHKHNVSTAAPATGIGGSNSEGTATSLARSDHNHALRTTTGPTDLTIGGISDGELLRRDGTTVVGGVGKKYPNSATDPSSPAPAAGDQYFNTSLNMTMEYDGSRSKWLSIASEQINAGRNGNTAAGSFYRGHDTLTMSATVGFKAPFAGTIVAIGYTRTDTDSATFEVTAGGTGISTLASTATSGSDATKNDNFSSGDVLALKNQTGGNTTTDVQVWARIKWRV